MQESPEPFPSRETPDKHLGPPKCLPDGNISGWQPSSIFRGMYLEILILYGYCLNRKTKRTIHSNSACFYIYKYPCIRSGITIMLNHKYKILIFCKIISKPEDSSSFPMCNSVCGTYAKIHDSTILHFGLYLQLVQLRYAIQM